jgi:hypothetical protein
MRMNLPESQHRPTDDLQDAHQHDGREQVLDAVLGDQRGP